MLNAGFSVDWTLSRARDGCTVDRAELGTFQDIVAMVDRLNKEGVTVYRRLSPRALTQLMQTACDEAADYYESLDPFATSGIGVSWAGEMTSPVWFHVARELTERWHHQQQIRLATGRPGIMNRSLCYPVLDTFLRGLPYTFRDVAASAGDALLIEGLRRLRRSMVPDEITGWMDVLKRPSILSESNDHYSAIHSVAHFYQGNRP